METLMSFVNSGTEEVILASNRPKRTAGRKKFTETRHPVYRCVRRRKNDKWVCEVREPNKKSRLWLGTYETAEMAARAYDVAAIALRGTSTCLNFADSVWRLPIPVSGDAKDIRKAAAEAAELFGPNGRETLRIECLIPLTDENENMFLVDDDEEFGMVGLLDCMAEGLLLPPPPHVETEFDWDNEQIGGEVSLWSFAV